jgi:integrase
MAIAQKSRSTPILRNKGEITVKNTSPAINVPTQDYIHAASSDNTRKAYQSDIRHFIQWGGLLPTTADVVLRYLQQHAAILNPRTLLRRLTAIKQWHLYQNFADPTTHPAVKKTLTGIAHVHGQPKKKAVSLTLDALIAMSTHLNTTSRLIDCRNAALLQAGFFGAFRRSELVAIQWEHIDFVPEGIEILIPRSKTDQAGEGAVCAIPYGDDSLCPVTALIRWRDRSQQKTGAVFRQITKGQTIKEEGIKPNQVNIILKSIATACGLPHPEQYSGHSLRRGFATQASKHGVPFGSIMRQGRWRHEGTVLGYMDEGRRFNQNAADIILHPDKHKL